MSITLRHLKYRRRSNSHMYQELYISNHEMVKIKHLQSYTNKLPVHYSKSDKDIDRRGILHQYKDIKMSVRCLKADLLPHHLVKHTTMCIFYILLLVTLRICTER